MLYLLNKMHTSLKTGVRCAVSRNTEAFKKLVSQGWIDALRKLYPDEKIYTFWDYFRNAYGRDAGIRIDHFLLSPELEKRLVPQEWTGGCAVGRRPVTMLPYG